MAVRQIDIDGKTMILRHPSIGDASRMKDFINAISGEGGNSIQQQSIESQTAYIEEALRRMKTNRGATVLAECDGSIVANVDFVKSGDDGTAKMGLLVSKQYRNKRIGRLMIGEICDAAKSMGVNNMTLTVRKGNGAAQYLYKSTGFQEYQTESPDEQKLAMYKNI
jgi:ribosomal protein S18 acetylase RimI-like enzyme